MDEREYQEFDLDDIIREFSNSTDEPENHWAIEEETKEPEETEGFPEPELEDQEDEVAVTVTNATIRLDAIPEARGTVRNAQHIEDDEGNMTPAQQPEQTEPYSEEWEPEYEQPIGEYVPPRPIIFRPRSRLRELKRKLVAGPERLYYTLSEKGLGRLQTAIFFCALLVLVSAIATAMYAVGMVQENRMRLMVFGQFLIMLLSALFGCYQLIEGVTDLRHKRFSLNTMLVFTFVICCADSVVCLRQLRVPCCAAFGLQMTMSLWNSYHTRSTKLGQLDTMRKATRLDCISPVDDYYEGNKGLVRGEGQVEDFMDTLDQPSKLENVLNIYALVVTCVSIVLGIVSGVLHGISTGIQVAAVTTLAALPASMFVTISRPMAVLERRHHGLGTVLCGWQGVDGLCGKALFPLGHEDLFPVGNVKMNGVKFYGNRQPDEIIAYAAALIGADGGSLEPLFTHLLDSRNGMHYPVQEFHHYENGGIGGEVNGEPVLMGSMSFLQQMGVEVPEGIRVNRAICVAVDGELGGLFAATYEQDRASTAGINTLCSYRGLKPILTTDDFVLTEAFIREQFNVKTKRMVFPEHNQRKALRERVPEVDRRALALVTGEGLAPFAYAVTGARALKSAAKTGIAVHMIGGILGIAMMAVLGVLGATEYLTPASMFLYELVWMIPGLLITEWTRSI